MAERCREAGMDGYLTKPIVRDRLTEELERWLPVAFELRVVSTELPQRRSRPFERVEDSPASTGSIDFAAFTSQLGIEPGREARELLASLWESLESLGSELEKALQAQNRGALREAAHGGKGAAHSVGAMALGDACAVLQDAADSADWSALAQQVADVVAQHRRASDDVAALVKS
jgi:two-component system sensor histidine kinase/response regulator